MTKKEFKEKHKDGLNVGMVNFLKTLHIIMTGTEIDNLIGYTSGREKRWLKKYKKYYREFIKDWDSPFWTTIMDIKSTELLRDIIGIMILGNKAVYNGEHEQE